MFKIILAENSPKFVKDGNHDIHELQCILRERERGEQGEGKAVSRRVKEREERRGRRKEGIEKGEKCYKALAVGLDW